MSQFRAGIDVSKGTYNIIKGNSSGLWIGSNTSTVDINSSKLNISSSNVSIFFLLSVIPKLKLKSKLKFIKKAPPALILLQFFYTFYQNIHCQVRNQ